MIGPDPVDEPAPREIEIHDARMVLATLNAEMTLALAEVAVALVAAVAKHQSFGTVHHALGVIGEEFDEFKEKVRADDRGNQRHEAAQLGAMTARFLMDVSATTDAQREDGNALPLVKPATDHVALECASCGCSRVIRDGLPTDVVKCEFGCLRWSPRIQWKEIKRWRL